MNKNILSGGAVRFCVVFEQSKSHPLIKQTQTKPWFSRDMSTYFRNHTMGVFNIRVMGLWWFIGLRKLFSLRHFEESASQLIYWVDSPGWWFQPLWKIWASWDDYSQYMESHKNHVPNHQPVSLVRCLTSSTSTKNLWSVDFPRGFFS